MFSFNTGRKFANDVADLIGIDRQLFSSALLEYGITWQHFKVMKKSGTSPTEASKFIMLDLCNGLAVVRQKYGEQPLISSAERAVAAYLEIIELPAAVQEAGHDTVASSEYPSGRYRLEYLVETNEGLHGQSLEPTQHLMFSDTLDDLKNIGLVKKLAGINVNLTDMNTLKKIEVL